MAFLEARPEDVARVLATKERRAEIEGAARAAGVRIEPAEPRDLDSVAGGTAHQGVAAVGRPPRTWTLPELIDQGPEVILLLDGVTDPRNVGALLRTAEACGVGGVVLMNDRAPGLTPALVKAAAGATEWLPLARVANLARSLDNLRRAGFWVIGLDAEGDCGLDDPDAIPGLPVALVVGAEGPGMRPLVQRSCHRLVRVPMQGNTPSLNVSVAGAIALWEVNRRRMASAASGKT